ncbi:MmyB family transcriptional regulator [Nocardia tengchongensis]|uniref:MmyB family transcriptional regulator n=1 Tax=Nocardia tengchongensis TaxID=2055889 RepID=UPI00364727BD
MADKALRGRFKHWRQNVMGVSRNAYGPLIGHSGAHIQNLEYGTRKLTPEAFVKMIQAGDIPNYLHEPLAELYLGGIVKAGSGKWPGEIPPRFRRHLDRHPDPIILLKAPEQELLYLNPAAYEIGLGFLAPAPPGADEPTNMMLATLFDPEARKIWVNWEELAHKMVFMWKWRAQDIGDPARIARVVEQAEKHPDWRRFYDNDLDLAQVARNVSLLRHPATGEIMQFETVVSKGFYPYLDEGEIVVMNPVFPEDDVYEL